MHRKKGGCTGTLYSIQCSKKTESSLHGKMILVKLKENLTAGQEGTLTSLILLDNLLKDNPKDHGTENNWKDACRPTRLVG